MENNADDILQKTLIMKSLHTKFLGVFLLFSSATFAQSEKQVLPPPPPAPPAAIPAPPAPPTLPAKAALNKEIPAMPPPPPPPPAPLNKKEKLLKSE